MLVVKTYFKVNCRKKHFNIHVHTTSKKVTCPLNFLSKNSLCMLFCWRFLHKHMAIKASRMSTITPRTQPTIR